MFWGSRTEAQVKHFSAANVLLDGLRDSVIAMA